MRIHRPDDITDEQYKRYLIKISEFMLNRIHQETKTLEFLSYSEREQVQKIITPIITHTPIKENVYKLADASLQIKKIQSSRQTRITEFADMIYDTHLALRKLSIISEQANAIATASV